MSIKLTIFTEFEQVAREQGKTIAPLSDNMMLFESGLDSLCFAIIVTRLEDALGIDPFDSGQEEEPFPVTLGDFVKLYENAAAR
jgi:acyl carrier protein